ncbi:MAG: RNA polymerase sigma factor RpoD, partial [Hyphomicrobiales bacterium]|nr:RNA polymerase sigma factor RpoD [Hyphomicrobiales bacterium]
MAATKAAEKAEAPTAPQEGHDGPLLDLSDAAVKQMIKTAKKRGYVTYEELNEVMPSEEVTSEQIEDTLSMLSEMGINVIESEELEENDANADNDDSDNDSTEGGELVEAQTQQVTRQTQTREPADRTD